MQDSEDGVMQYLKEKQKTAGPVRRQKAKVSFPVRKPVVVAALMSCKQRSEADAAMEYLKVTCLCCIKCIKVQRM